MKKKTNRQKYPPPQYSEKIKQKTSVIDVSRANYRSFLGGWVGRSNFLKMWRKES